MYYFCNDGKRSIWTHSRILRGHHVSGSTGRWYICLSVLASGKVGYIVAGLSCYCPIGNFYWQLSDSFMLLSLELNPATNIQNENHWSICILVTLAITTFIWSALTLCGWRGIADLAKIGDMFGYVRLSWQTMHWSDLMNCARECYFASKAGAFNLLVIIYSHPSEIALSQLLTWGMMIGMGACFASLQLVAKRRIRSNLPT